jgi:uncharacterized glyoxalase superfamily protein PhnB
MATHISPMLAVSDPDGAIDFYQRAFGAEVRWRIGEPTQVAGLTIAGAELFLARENPPKTRGPDVAGHTTVRIELFVDRPEDVQEQAVAAGAREANAVQTHSHNIVGQASPMRMLQGGVVDPFGHHWLIGKFVE